MELIERIFKQTEAGFIPEDWEVKRLGEVAKTEGGYAFKSSKFLNNGTYQIIKMSNVYGGLLDLNRSQSFLNELDSLEKHYILNKGDILITLTGTVGKKDYGYTVIIDDYKNLLLNQRVARIVSNDNVNANYVFFQLKMPNFSKQFFEASKGGTGNQTNVGTQQVDNIVIAIPPLEEQKAISTALSDVGALLANLEKLIIKKEAIKQGAMQQLLTPPNKGGKRLAGFTGEWVETTLGEISDIDGAGVDKKINPNEISVTLLNYLDVYRRDYIYRNELNHIVTSTTSKVSSCNVKKGDVFLTPSSELRTDIGLSAIAMEDMDGVVYSYHIDRLRYKIDIDKMFGLYMLKTRDFLSQAETMCEGSGKRYVLSMNKFRAMRVYYPKTKEEQIAIASTIFDIDSELNILERKKRKYEVIKQGMMQELLTGKTRLV